MALSPQAMPDVTQFVSKMVLDLSHVWFIHEQILPGDILLQQHRPPPMHHRTAGLP